MVARGEVETHKSHIVGTPQWRRNEFESGGGGTGPTRKWGAPNGGKQLLVVFPQFFGSKSTIIPFGKRVRAGQYSLVSFFFTVLLLMVPPVPSHL